MELTEDVLSETEDCPAEDNRTLDRTVMDIIGQGGGTRYFIAFCDNIIWERNV